MSSGSSSSLSVSLAFGETILIRYVESALLILGIIGSLLNIILFSGRKLRSNSCCIYFLTSSVPCIVLLLIGVIPTFYALDHTPSSIFNRNFCKARGYIVQLSGMLYRWLLVMACIDRCLLTSTNAYLRRFSTVDIARRTIIVLSILWLIIPIHMIIFTDVRKMGYITCIMSTNGSAFYNTIYTIIFGGILPPLIMLICTKIIWKSLQLKRHRQAMLNVNLEQKKQERRDIQVLLMLLLQILISIILTLPLMCFNIYLAFTRSVRNKSVDRLAIESFLQTFTEMTLAIYASVAFYLNILVSQTFRNELRILCYKIFSCHHNQIDPSTDRKIVTKRNELPMSMINKNNQPLNPKPLHRLPKVEI